MAYQAANFDLDSRIARQRKRVERNLRDIVHAHYPEMLAPDHELEYRKMIELSNKMSLVGLACTLIAGYPFDARRQRISSLFGACCFLGDSFLDDFGDDAAHEYLDRYELLITKGWFEVRNPRERLFYVILARLFAERDMLDLMLRQAIVNVYLSQKRDVELRSQLMSDAAASRGGHLQQLRECARDRSGHAITVLSHLLVPQIPLRYTAYIFAAGSLIMHIDDHGDSHFDRFHHRLTFMNQVRDPVRTLRRIFDETTSRIRTGLPESAGRELLLSFLQRYYRTRLRKHRLERLHEAQSWTVYE